MALIDRITFFLNQAGREKRDVQQYLINYHFIFSQFFNARFLLLRRLPAPVTEASIIDEPHGRQRSANGQGRFE